MCMYTHNTHWDDQGKWAEERGAATRVFFTKFPPGYAVLGQPLGQLPDFHKVLLMQELW